MSYQLHRISVLVVEDSKPMMQITKSLLLTFGIGQVIEASDGKAGFNRYCEHQPDIVLADWMMQPVDGIELTRMIRTDPHSPDPYVPIILMTGFSEKKRVFSARDAGVTEFLVKPFTARDLYKRIAQVIERPRQFVHSEDFFGPDRRRKRSKKDLYQGPYRRQTDVENNELLNKIREQQLEAQKKLKEIREKTGLSKGDRFDLKPEDIEMVVREK